MTAQHERAQDQLVARLHKKEQELRIVGDKEPFDYYLSAFLNAGMGALA
jgi:hypothetical protein